jgi:hypothetical protein
MTPRAGTATALSIPGEAGDQLFTFNGGFTTYTFDDVDLVWTPTEPNLNVGQGFFYTKSSVANNPNWVQNFTVQ